MTGARVVFVQEYKLFGTSSLPFIYLLPILFFLIQCCHEVLKWHADMYQVLQS